MSETTQQISKTQFLLRLANHLAKSKKPVIYVAGKVSGLKPEDYEAKFKKAEQQLESQGFHVLNPCAFISPDCDWKFAMRLALTLLNMADHIYLLPDWTDSPGAQWEFEQSLKLGLNAIFEAEITKPVPAHKFLD
ncbi:DUF4406 domain-containing protein [Mucilaginibacter sp. L3T2-6]|uniref:DUF4406 domain-containing protein n=1 Tax=Mucilaginibacter sp. L3T2-6 TaxID=3062491 RepID=UPI0026768D76|nr:DUF4406 domain-containing protein [Mucilaginibacter sp. L3T2-6]MDO3641954.1 DUF4406 domain-containing protein [Mucilaginibacter sp. L3T2-6]MDV6214368.1 DUF4406 domain-containing protein [Mucilaginibacter sp. L3T2-6]